MALWVNFVATDGQQILVEKWVQRSLEPEIVSGWTLTKLPDNHVSFAVAERTYVEVDSAPLDIPLHTWVHFAARRGAARRRGDTIQILMNGDVIASHTAPNAGTLDPDSLSSIKFGHRGDPCDTPGSVSDQGFFLNGLNGRIDEVKFRYRAGPVEPGDPGDSGEGGRRKALLVDERAAAATPNR